MACNEPDSASLKEKEKPFREGWDCLRKDATEEVYGIYIYKYKAVLIINTFHLKIDD